MPKYAQVDRTQSPPLVIAYYDTDVIDYPNLPALADLVELTQQDWQQRMSQVGWVIENGVLVLPPPSPAVQAAATFSQAIANGILVTSTGDPALSARYALDDVTMTQIGSVARDAAAGLGLPGGGDTFVYPDADSQPHALTAAQVIALYRAMRDLLLTLNTQVQIVRAGGTAAWPTQSITIP